MASFEGSSFEILKSCEDKRDYRGYELDNKMKVLLVSDPTTEKSAASVDVHIGEYTTCNQPSLILYVIALFILPTSNFCVVFAVFFTILYCKNRTKFNCNLAS